MKKQMQNNIDISTNTYLNPYKCKQGDIIKWIVDLSDLGASVDLTGRTVICNIVKANNTFLKQTSGITITGSKIDITLDQQATQIPGQTKISLTISKTGEKATTFSKLLEVEKNDTEDLIPSSNIVTIIDQLDAKILEADTIKKALDTSIDNGNVAKMRADVDKNTTDIATNKTNITTNTTDITALKTNKFDKNLGDKNTNDITFLSNDLFEAKNRVTALETKDTVNTLINSNKTSVTVFPKAVTLNGKIYDKLIISGYVSHADISGGTCTQEPVGAVTWCHRTRPITIPVKLSTDIRPSIVANSTYMFWDLNSSIAVNATDIVASFLLKTTSVASANDADANKYVHYIIIGYRESV